MSIYTDSVLELYNLQCRVTLTALLAVLFSMSSFTETSTCCTFSMSCYSHSAICCTICNVVLHSQRYLLYYLQCRVSLTALSAVLFGMSNYTDSAFCCSICNVDLQWQRFLLYYLQCRVTLTALLAVLFTMMCYTLTQSAVLFSMKCYTNSAICSSICNVELPSQRHLL
jgi:hypothetical protein